MSPDRIRAAQATPRIFTRYQSGPVLYFPDEPKVAGGCRGSYVFERRLVAPGQLPPHVFEDHMFLLVLGETGSPFHSRLSGRQITGHFEPGKFRFVAAGDSLSTRWTHPIDSILVAMHPDTLRRALGDDTPNGTCELVSNAVFHADPTLAHLTLALEVHLQHAGFGGRLFEQSLLTAMATHLVCSYAAGQRAKNRVARVASLPRWKRARVEDYIRDNLGRDDLHLGEIAAVVKLSPSQLSRAFRATTGQRLWQFVLECRVRAAMSMLRRHPSMRLEMIAHACGFESYSQFIAAFRGFYGQLPSELRRSLGAR